MDAGKIVWGDETRGQRSLNSALSLWVKEINQRTGKNTDLANMWVRTPNRHQLPQRTGVWTVADLEIFDGGANEPEEPRRRGILGERQRGAASPSPPARGLGKRCKLPQRGPERSPGSRSCNFSSQDGFRNTLNEMFLLSSCTVVWALECNARYIVTYMAQLSQDMLNRAIDQLPKRLMMVIKIKGAHVEFRLD